MVGTCECTTWAYNPAEDPFSKVRFTKGVLLHHAKCPKGNEVKKTYHVHTADGIHVVPYIKDVLEYVEMLLKDEQGEAGQSLVIDVKNMTINEIEALPEL